ncbi:hypothetical protein ES288_D11G247600v1 [Gossypium darwinii]|uniref:Uncharacterized protein n=1 Tax=Gossypium darwinii TaxID=34276 RepID=A0A5D2ASZ7_GOSDA|nr:hypothetical protein ES288_D11G247600v1 [Gossypium darwinii]
MLLLQTEIKRYYEGQSSMLESRPSDPEPPDPKPIWSFFCQKLYQTESSPSCSLLVVYGFYPHLRLTIKYRKKVGTVYKYPSRKPRALLKDMITIFFPSTTERTYNIRGHSFMSEIY